MISILPYAGIFAFLIQYVYPAWSSLKTVEHATETSTAQWCTYWIICVLYLILESCALVFVLDYVPLYQELKCLVFGWLVHPDFMGAAYLWYKFMQPLHKPLDDQYYSLVMDKIKPAPKAEEKRSQKFDEAQDDDDKDD